MWHIKLKVLTSRVQPGGVMGSLSAKWKSFRKGIIWHIKLKVLTSTVQPREYLGEFGRLVCWHPNTIITSYYYSSNFFENLSARLRRNASTDLDETFGVDRGWLKRVHSTFHIDGFSPGGALGVKKCKISTSPKGIVWYIKLKVSTSRVQPGVSRGH